MSDHLFLVSCYVAITAGAECHRTTVQCGQVWCAVILNRLFVQAPVRSGGLRSSAIPVRYDGGVFTLVDIRPAWQAVAGRAPSTVCMGSFDRRLLPGRVRRSDSTLLCSCGFSLSARKAEFGPERAPPHDRIGEPVSFGRMPKGHSRKRPQDSALLIQFAPCVTACHILAGLRGRERAHLGVVGLRPG